MSIKKILFSYFKLSKVCKNLLQMFTYMFVQLSFAKIFRYTCKEATFLHLLQVDHVTMSNVCYLSQVFRHVRSRRDGDCVRLRAPRRVCAESCIKTEIQDSTGCSAATDIPSARQWRCTSIAHIPQQQQVRSDLFLN